MRVQRIGSTKKARLLPTRALWLCSLAVTFAIVLVLHPLQHKSFAQSPPSQAAVAPAASNPAPANAQDTASAPAPEQQAKQDVKVDPAAERKKQISDEAADLLKLANSLKAEMDKTTRDTLSVAVIRRAGEIEQLAHKMRTR
ncbi:MAG TPA: hypothetical protein VGT08_15520 [Terracidiphilus sp.]|nr:hypothetical protein [Terracidiphilus sp.]